MADTRTTQIIPAEAVQATEEVDVFLKAYEGFEITTALAYSSAGEDLKALKANWKVLDAKRKELTKPLDESKKKIKAFFDAPMSRIKTAEANVSSAMVGWHNEQERIRKAEEDRLRKAQLKEATRLAKLAEKAQARGDTAKMNEFDARAEEVSFAAPAVVPTAAAKISGLAVTKLWRHRIIDANKIPREYMIPNDKVLGQLARSSKGLFKIDGVEFYYEDSVRGTRQ